MEDWMPTSWSGSASPTSKQKLLTGTRPAGKTYKVHLDGYDQTTLITDQGPSKRKEFYYFTENVFHGVRYGDWKFLFSDQDKWFNGRAGPAGHADHHQPEARSVRALPRGTRL